MKPIPLVNLKDQYKAYKKTIVKATKNVFESTQFLGGKTLEDFEKNLADFATSDENESSSKTPSTLKAIGCSSGTTALQLALMAIGIKPGDEVITTPFTFIATAEVVALLHAKPVFVDIDPSTLTINTNLIEKAITPKTKAIIPVSIFGTICNMEAICEIASKHKLVVIEDAAQSFGTTYHKKKSCTLSEIAITSFYPSKPLGCYGDGGAVFTFNETWEKKIRSLLNHGLNTHEKNLIGLNGRIDNLQVAILNIKLKHFKKEIKKRQENANYYKTHLPSGHITYPEVPAFQSSVYAQFSVFVPAKKRDALIKHLNHLGVSTTIFYNPPIHLNQAFAFLKHKKGDFPISEKISQEIVSLPFGSFLKRSHQKKIVRAFHTFKF